MESIIDILFWVSIFSGGLLVFLLILSLIGGLDLDTDLGPTDIDTDAGGLGLFKGFLTFLSTGAWMVKIMIAAKQNIWLAVATGIAIGILCFILINFLVRLMLKAQSNVNWSVDEALYQTGKVYLKIPASSDESGIVQIEINEAFRELKAKSRDDVEIPTGEAVRVVDIKGEYVIVEKETL